MFKKVILVAVAAMLLNCGELETVSITGLDGKDGNKGSNGDVAQDGFNSLLTVTSLDAEQGLCQSGHGIVIASGLDTNRNTVLEPEEINENSVAVLCDGAAGLQGPQGPIGPAGQDGVDGVNGMDGLDGINGQDGTDGTNGEDGSSITLLAYELTTSCQDVGNGFYAKKNGTNAEIYTHSTCSNSSKVSALNENSDEVYIINSLMFIVENGPLSVKLFKVLFSS